MTSWVFLKTDVNGNTHDPVSGWIWRVVSTIKTHTRAIIEVTSCPIALKLVVIKLTAILGYWTMRWRRGWRIWTSISTPEAHTSRPIKKTSCGNTLSVLVIKSLTGIHSTVGYDISVQKIFATLVFNHCRSRIRILIVGGKAHSRKIAITKN
jgi:hypothetical protein